jgi:hypothetical protein
MIAVGATCLSFDVVIVDEASQATEAEVRGLFIALCDCFIFFPRSHYSCVQSMVLIYYSKDSDPARDKALSLLIYFPLTHSASPLIAQSNSSVLLISYVTPSFYFIPYRQ